MSTKTKATHTPGPWKAGVTSLNIYADDGRHIADTRRAAGFYDGEQEANAVLMAASPELLEACLLAEKQSLPAQVLIALRSAIVKAGGGM